MLPQKSAYLLALGVATAVIPTTILSLMANRLFFVPLLVGVVVLCLGMWSGNTDKNARFASALVLFAWLGPFLITMYLRKSGPPVAFVVPAGYHRMIEVVEDQAQGEDLRFEHGTYTIEVPVSGVIRLKDTSPFHRWHEEWCREPDGKPRHLDDQGTETQTVHSGIDNFTIHRWQVR